MDVILGLPVLVKVLASLGSILVVNGLTRRLALSVAVGAVLLGVWCGYAPRTMVAIAWERLLDSGNLGLLGTFFLVIWFSSQMAASGILKDLVAAVRRRVSHRTALALLPALVGLLPMPGGAAFSAPLVDDVDHGRIVEPLLKTQINYWFRHPWEYWWPLYPGVLMAIELSGLAIWQFMLLMVPISLVFTLAGMWFLLRRVPKDTAGAHPHVGIVPPLLRLLLPTLAVVVVFGGLLVVAPQVGRLNRYLPLAIGMVVAMAILQWERPLPWSSWRRIVLADKALSLVLLVALIRVYGAFIEGRLPNGVLLVEQMRGELADWGLPVLATAMVLPLVSGLVTGIAVGFVGASFPIVFSLLGAEPSLGRVLSVAVLAYGFGHIGMMFSPVHVCLVVSNQHFRTRLFHSLARLVAPGLVVLAAAAVCSWACQWLLG